MHITQKGQITIPKTVRDKAGVTMATELEVDYRNGMIVIEKIDGGAAQKLRREREFDNWLSKARGAGDTGLSADEIMAMTREPVDDIGSR